MADINKVWLSGVVVHEPILTKLQSKTSIATFTLQVNERYLDRFGIWQTKPNLIKIESLGKSAESTAEKVRQGSRFTIDGYLRKDANEEIKIRTFAVYADDSADNANYHAGVKQALEVVRKSRDTAAAIQKLEELLNKEKSCSNIISPIKSQF